MRAASSDDLEVLFRISYAVHSVVRQTRHSPHQADVIGIGASGNPTEEIDRVAEAQVLSVLEEEGVDWNLLSEEVGRVNRGGTRTLVVDPIDGSHNALRGLPFATISLALGQGTLGDLEVGVVHDLFRGANYWAVRGGGAFLDGRRIRTRPWTPREELFCVNLGRHSTPRAVALSGKGRRIRSLGCASYEMALVARGTADAYLFENDTPNRNLRVTDIAAAYLLLAEAGGGASDAEGRPIDRVPLEIEARTSLFAWGDPRFAEAARREGYL
ncbi:MAG TPA: inositol monophosphatase family protein [Thermoplasmata archaeon]|nr:inositol monophosphatase family protein [Thermoplasmata archaeon]